MKLKDTKGLTQHCVEWYIAPPFTSAAGHTAARRDQLRAGRGQWQWVESLSHLSTVTCHVTPACLPPCICPALSSALINTLTPALDKSARAAVKQVWPRDGCRVPHSHYPYGTVEGRWSINPRARGCCAGDTDESHMAYVTNGGLLLLVYCFRIRNNLDDQCL